MKTFSFIWTDRLRAEIGQAAPLRGYAMSLVGEDRQAVIAAVNQGIDAHLEACFVPDLGDVFEPKTRKVGSRCGGHVLACKVSQESMPVLLRRLFEGQEPDQHLAQDILDNLMEDL